MKLKKYLAILPFVFATGAASAETTAKESKKGSVFYFSTQVNRTVEKDLMFAEVYSRKTGKSLAELKKTVSKNLNKILEEAKQNKAIEVSSEGLRNFADYDKKGKVIGWVAEGSISMKSKDFDAIAKILENLGEDVAIRRIDFSVSPEKLASLEDEMTLEIIKQFQHKANVIQKGLNAKSYVLDNINLNTGNRGGDYPIQPVPYRASMKVSAMDSAAPMESIPMEAGKATISASASGNVTFELNP